MIGLDTEFINIEIAIIIVITLTQALLILRLLTLLWPKIMYDYRLLGIIIVILQMLIDCLNEDNGWLCSSLYSLILPLLLVFLSVPNSDIDLNLNPDIDPELEIPKEVLMIFVTIQLLIFNASDLSGENNDLKSKPLTAVVIIQLLIIIKLTINILKGLLF
jgi:hypothetical protein